MFRNLCLLFSVLLLVSCTHTPPKGKPTGLTANDFWKEQEQRAHAANAISGKVRVRYEGRREKVSGKGLLLAQLPDQVRLELRDPLGRTHYIAGLNGQQMVAYYPRQNLAYLDGSKGNNYLKKIFGMDVSFSEFHQILLGILPSTKPGTLIDSWAWDEERGLYRAQLKIRGNTAMVWIDPESGVLQECLLTIDVESVRVVYQEFSSCCEKESTPGISLAQVVTISLDKAKTSVDFEWDKIDSLAVLKSAESFQVAIPEGVRTIPLN